MKRDFHKPECDSLQQLIATAIGGNGREHLGLTESVNKTQETETGKYQLTWLLLSETRANYNKETYPTLT